MKSPIQKSDFLLHPYMHSNNQWATYQILTTLVPYILLWFLSAQLAPISLWFLPPIVALITLFSVRCFSLMHDCGHYSLFSSKAINRIVGFTLGVINAIPQYAWSRDHAYHHKTNGDWERYRGIADFLSVAEFAQLSPAQQHLYELLRHPLMAFPGGFFYLAIKPRLALVCGIYDLMVDLWHRPPQGNTPLGFQAQIAAHTSKYWISIEEFWDLLLNNICVVGGWIFLCHWLGAGFFLGIYSIVLTFAAAIFISVFFVQHNFEGSYAHQTDRWDYLLGALEGSSYLVLPPPLKWFCADIGFHNIHHLSERIPNYHLEACYHQNIHLLRDIKTLHLSDLPTCAKFILWDADRHGLTSVEAFRQGQSESHPLHT